MQLEPRVPDRPALIPSLTGIRGIAALWVLLFHIQNIATLNGFVLGMPGYSFFNAGWTGVDFFFLLSGFMLMHAHAMQFRTLRWIDLKKFAISRFFRIYPLSAVVLICILMMVFVDQEFSNNFKRLAPGNLSLGSFVQTLFLATRWGSWSGNWNEPVWSLSSEIVGYAFFPIIALVISRIKRLGAAIAILIVSIVLVLLYQWYFRVLGFNDMSLSGSLARMAGYFIAGISLRKVAEFGVGERTLVKPSICALFATAAIAILPFIPLGSGFMAIPFSLLIYAMFFQKGAINTVLSSRASIFLGKISFPLYLIHVMPLLSFNFHAQQLSLSTSHYRAGLFALIASLIVTAWLLHQEVERKAHKIGRKILC